MIRYKPQGSVGDSSWATSGSGGIKTASRVGVAGEADATAALAVTGKTTTTDEIDSAGVAKAVSFQPHTAAADLFLRLRDDSKKISVCKTDGTEVASFDATGALVVAGKSGIGGAADETFLLNVASESSIKTAGAIEIGTTIRVGGPTGLIIKKSSASLLEILDSDGVARVSWVTLSIYANSKVAIAGNGRLLLDYGPSENNAYLSSAANSKQIDFYTDDTIRASLNYAGLRLKSGGTSYLQDAGSGIEIYDSSTLAAESLAETDFATHATWDDSGDMNSESGYAQYTHSTGVGTLTQLAANQAVAAVAGAWYKLVITFANVVAGCTAELTTAFAKVAQSINIATGAQTLYYKAADAPTDFQLDIASVVSGAFRITAISNKQMTDAEVLNLHGSAKINGTITQRGSKYLGGLQHGVAQGSSGPLSGASGSIAVNVPDGAYITAVSLKNAVEVTGATSTTAAFAGGSTAAIGAGIANAKNTATDVVYSPAEAVSGAVATIALTPADSNYTGGEIVAVVYYDLLDSIPDFA